MSQELKDCLDEIYGYLVSKLDDLEALDDIGLTSQITYLMHQIIKLIKGLI